MQVHQIVIIHNEDERATWHLMEYLHMIYIKRVLISVRKLGQKEREESDGMSLVIYINR